MPVRRPARCEPAVGNLAHVNGLTRIRSHIGFAALIAIVAAALLAFATQPASAVTASAAAVQDLDVSLVGDENDGQYAWDGMKDPWIKDADAIFVNSGSTRFFFVWPPSNGSHDVKLRASQSTPGLSFPNSVLHQNYGTEDERWPSAGWLPVKAGTYQLYCSKHTGMKMRVIVKAQLARIGAKTNRGTVRRGTKVVTGVVVTNSSVRARLKVVLCTNRSCSRSRDAYNRVLDLRSGRSEIRLPLRSGLGPGSYRFQVLTAALNLNSAFSVK